MASEDAAQPRYRGPPQPQIDIPLDSLFAAMSDVVFVIDSDGRYLWGAPTIAAETEEARGRARWLLGKTIHEAVGEQEQADRMLATVRAALETGVTQDIEYQIKAWGTPEWYSASVSRLSDDRVVWVARNVTELVGARTQLEQRVEERTSELAALLEVSRALAAETGLESLVDTMLTQLRLIVDYTGASVIRIEGTKIKILDSIGPEGKEQEIIGQSIELKERTPHWWSAISRGEALVVRDVHDSEEGRDFQELLAEYKDLPAFGYIRSWMAAPLVVEGRVLGWISMSKDEPDFFTDHHIELATAVARQAAVVAENATLFEESRRRAREQASLLDVSRAITSTLDLRELLEAILDQLRKFVDYAGAAVILREEGEMMRQAAVLRPRGPAPTPEDTADSFPVSAWRGLGLPIDEEEFVLIDDVHGASPSAVLYRSMHGGNLEGTRVEYVRSFLGLSLVVRGNILGVLTLAHDEPGFFGEQHVELLRPFAVQAAIAIENASLFQQTEARSRELAAILEVSRTVASSLDISHVLRIVLAELERLVGVTGASVLTIEGDLLVFRDVINVPGRRDQVGLGIPLASAGLMWNTLADREPVVIPDIRADPPMAADYRRTIDELGMTGRGPFQHVRSWMGVPLFVQDRIIGMLTMSRTDPDYFTSDHARLAGIFADQVAVAIENARLFEQTQARTRELAAVLQVSRAIATTLDLNEVIDAVLDNLQQIVEHTGSALITLEGDDLIIRGSRATEGGEREVGLRVPMDRGGFIWQQMLLQKPVLIPDIRADETAANGYRQTIDSIGLLNVPPFSHLRAWMGVPLIVGDRVIGILSLSHTEPGRFTEDHARLAASFGAQVAAAIENARLYERAQGVAALEERQRLARDLHDSVSQALYGIALGARTAMTQLERDATKAGEPVEYILSLAEAGLAEMRALIFELRPESMEMEGLVAAIGKQVAAGRARYGIAIDAELGDEPEAPLETKEALYRIAQEALHNIVKHAGATHVIMSLESQDSALVLRVTDNGAGFDPTADYAGHLGLRSMRERASLIGGSLHITSEPGVGTAIVATVPLGR
jgi:GAF domain-containing protein